jgi:type II secretory pathway component GspD/PulD (secretin)
MQLRSILVPLLAALPGACTSTNQAERASIAPSAAPSPAAEAAVVEAAAPAATASTPVVQEGAQPVQEGAQLSEDAARLERLRQQGRFLSAQYEMEGDRALERADLSAALRAYASALETDQESTSARDKMRKVEALMGDRYAGAAAFLEDATEQEVVRRAQARMAAEEHIARGKTALAAGDHQSAIDEFRAAEMIVRYNPLVAQGALELQAVQGQLETAIRMSDEAVAGEMRRREEEAAKARAAREAEEAAYFENKLRTLYAQANTAFLAEDYAKAEALTNQILLESPGNKDALELRQTARDMRHAQADESNRRHYREQWIRTIEELDTMNVPQTEALVFDDLKRWAEVSRRQPLEFSALSSDPGGEKAAVLARLDETIITPKFLGADGEGSPLEEVAAFLQSVSQVNFVISPKVMEELDEEQRMVKLDLPERSVKKLLDLMAETSESLRWKVQDGVVKFVVKDELKGGQTLKNYEVNDLIRPIQDFPGREMNVAPTGGVQVTEEEATEREANVVTGDQLDTLIRNNVAPGSWDADPDNSLRISNGTMVVNQTPEVHEQIAKLLQDLREATGIMVDIQARFLSVEDNFLEDIGVDFRGLGQPGLGTNAFFNDFGDPSTQSDLGNEIGQGSDLGAFYDKSSNQEMRARVEELYDTTLGDEDVLVGSGGLSFQWTYLNNLQLQMVLRAVSKSERVELVTSPRITVHNTARGNLAVLNQVAYVQDFNVEIAQGSSIADPIVAVVQDGVVLDVRPVVSADRRFITLELRPTVAELRRPIAEIVTTLGSQNSVTIQLPEVDLRRVRTSIPMPDGGTVLLGGLKVSDRQDMNSGVPILNKIPLVSFFFDRKGHYVSNRKILVLLKAQILIPQELEPSEAQLRPTTRVERD